MSASAAVVERSVGVTDDPEALAGFLEPSCAAAVWRRQIPSSHQAWLDQLDPDTLPRGRIVLPRETVAQTVAELCEQSGLPHTPESDWLRDDIVSLSDRFATLMNAPYLRLRLDVVTNNACRKFHVDAITTRLVCTYRGTGTQYGMSTGGADPERIFTVPTGAPILLRGTLWSPKPASGLVHRSPPIEGTGETRLVLVLDPVRNPGDDY